MPKIHLRVLPKPAWNGLGEDSGASPERRSLAEVLDQPDSGASRRGSSYYKTLFTCPHEFALKYILGLEPAVIGEGLTVGKLFHLVQEHYYRGIQEHQTKVSPPRKPYSASTRIAWEHYWWGNANQAMQKAMAVVDPVSTEPGYGETWRVLERITGHYFDTRYKADRWRIIGVEETLEFEGDNGLEYSARLDGIVYDYDTKGMYVLELKSARYLSRDLVDNYQQDLQILGQQWLMRNCLDLREYPALLGTFVDIITKQETPKFERVSTNPSERHLAAFQSSIESWHRLKDYYEGEDWPRAYGKCAGAARGYSKCEFYDLCHDNPEMGISDWAKVDPPVGYVKKDRG